MFKNITCKVRLLFNRKKEPYLLFNKVLGFYPDNIKYYQLAVRHKSVPLETKDGKELSNERLEFLGDAVLNSIVTDTLYHRFPDENEGFLTNLRSKIVSRDSLNQLAIDIGLDKLVVATRYVNRNSNNNIYGNALEAIFGAIYLDYGYRKCESFLINRLLSSYIDLNEILESEVNYKSKVFEWCQKYHLDPEFVLLEETVNKNKHTFHTCLKINGQVISEAAGPNKKQSQQKASQVAFQRINNEPDFLATLQMPIEINTVENEISTELISEME